MADEMNDLQELVRHRINAKYDQLYWIDEAGICQPYVCLICDELLMPKEIYVLSIESLRKNASILKPSIRMHVPIELANEYSFRGSYGNIDQVERESSWITELILSPRACYIRRDDRRSREGFSLCSNCKYNMEHTSMPKNAIINGYIFGQPPKCLLDLTELELAMLTPVRTHGYCFSYTGGRQKQLKGSLSYYKINIESIVRTVQHFHVLGLTDNVVVL
jgi:hypothetical protein